MDNFLSLFSTLVQSIEKKAKRIQISLLFKPRTQRKEISFTVKLFPFIHPVKKMYVFPL